MIKMFFNKKYRLYLTKDEYYLIVIFLIDLKNNLIRQGRYTNAVDDILYKSQDNLTNLLQLSVLSFFRI